MDDSAFQSSSRPIGTSKALLNRLPGIELPETADLNEVHAMLAERVIEWTKQWKAEGLEEGRKEGEMTLLIKLLEHRFGPPDETTKARLDAADAEQLLLWGERVLTADSLESVFDDDSHSTSEP